MRAPGFWYARPGFRAFILSPLAAIYAFGTKRRLAQGKRQKLGIPVICVGNINVGGTGKTPTVIAIVERLTAMGAQPHVVSRGFGGSHTGPVQVDIQAHDADEVGDEPLLIAPFAPVWVAKDRAAGAQAAEAAGARVVILDDGFQNPDLYHDLSLIVVDAKRGFGNERVLPSGPLREPVEVGLARANAVLSIGTDQDQGSLVHRAPPELIYLTGKLVPVETGMDWSDVRAVAFAGIGNPEKFFDTLRQLGAQLVGTHALDDHQKLERPLLARLIKEAQTKNAQLVTTEKDAVRLPDDLRQQVFSLPVRLELERPEDLDRLLQKLV